MKKLALLAVMLMLTAGCDPEMGMARILQDIPDAGDDAGVDSGTDEDAGVDSGTVDGGAD